MATINIGLHKNTGGSMSARTALAALIVAGASVSMWTVQQSASEPTLVAEIDHLDPQALEALSVTLKQDCVAYCDEGGRGQLYGPKASEWGPFNPAYFLAFREVHAPSLDARA